MKKILIAGDSWGIGVFAGAGKSYGPTGQGIQSILETMGHTVINISRGGGSNWLMMDRLDGHWGDTGRCLFGTDSKPIAFDIDTVDYILFLQTDIFRERHYYGKQYLTDTTTNWKILEQAYIDSLLNYSSLSAGFDDYFAKLYTKLNQYGKKTLCIGGWSQLHPSITEYTNLIPVVPSATKLLIPELVEDTYISDPEWFIQLSMDTKFIQQFDTEFKLLSMAAADKIDLIYNNWHEVHPDIKGYQKIVDQILPYFG